MKKNIQVTGIKPVTLYYLLFMWIFLTHRLSFVSPENKESFLKRLNDHAVASKSLSYFTTTVQDYGIVVKFKQERTVIKEKFGRRNFILVLTLSQSSNGSKLHVMIRPSTGNMLLSILLAAFVSVITFQIEIIIGFVLTLLIFQWIALGFTVWWTKNFFTTRLMVTELPKDHNPLSSGRAW